MLVIQVVGGRSFFLSLFASLLFFSFPFGNSCAFIFVSFSPASSALKGIFENAFMRHGKTDLNYSVVLFLR